MATGRHAVGSAGASVVIPTRDRPEALGRCLEALARQTVMPLEVLVVDDGSADRAAVARTVRRSQTARLVLGPSRGPAAARNTGVRAARGDVVLFVDDDCLPEPAWVERMTTAVSASADVVVGRTEDVVPASPLATASQTVVDGLVEASLERSTGEVGFGPSCNLACRAELVRSVPFDEDYPLAAGEDRAWCAEVSCRGHSLRFEPAAVVGHAPALSAVGFLRQHVRYGRGAHRFRRRDGGRAAEGTRALILRRGFERGFVVGLLVVIAQVATAVGYALEALAARRETRRGAF